VEDGRLESLKVFFLMPDPGCWMLDAEYLIHRPFGFAGRVEADRLILT
jgi:hypothetical protein